MKTIKVSTLENKFQKLHLVANYAEDCMRAIAMHAGRLLENNYTDSLAQAVAEFDNAVEEWTGELAKFASLCQGVESQYYEHLMDNNTKCQLIEAVPTYPSAEVPKPDQMADTLFQMGYYTTDEDIYEVEDKVFTDEEILSDIATLLQYTIFCVKALANMNYSGVWEHVGQKACQIHDMFCEGPSAKLHKVVPTNF